jgi:N-acyl-D-amino-acid deacylase
MKPWKMLWLDLTYRADFGFSRARKACFACGYGLRNVEKRIPVEPATRFRIAGVSKTITAVTILRLCEERKLGLSDLIVERLPQFRGEFQSHCPDHRWHEITIRQVLQHTGGWDSRESFDPVFEPRRIEQVTGDFLESLPPDTVVRYMIGRNLDFSPGTRFAYSNFGYCLLGRIMEAASGQPYEEAISAIVLQPLGLTGIRAQLDLRRLSLVHANILANFINR